MCSQALLFSIKAQRYPLALVVGCLTVGLVFPCSFGQLELATLRKTGVGQREFRHWLTSEICRRQQGRRLRSDGDTLLCRLGQPRREFPNANGNSHFLPETPSLLRPAL